MPDDKKLSELTEETSIAATDLLYLAKDLGGGVFGERKIVADNIVPLTTKGDLLVHNTTVLARVPVGADGLHLEADSGAGAGVSWQPELFTSAKDTKLSGIEALADVTDTANVTAAGALMDSEVDADIKTLVLPASTTISAFMRTVLDDAAAVNARATLELIIGTDVQAFATVLQNTTASFLTADETKLDAIEALADVTDAANVNAAGAVMESDFAANSLRFKNNSSVMGNIVVAASQMVGRASTGELRNLTAADSRTILNVENNAAADQTGAEIKTAYEAETNAFTDAQFTKLGNIETLADVTDTGNVTSAGALMDSEVDADIKTLVLPASTTISAFGRTLIDDAAAINGRATLGVVIGTDVQAFATVLQNTTASFLTADETKLDNIETLADVTDTANVTSAGALMDSEVDADLKTFVLPANTTISAFGRTLIDDAAAINARSTLGVVIGTNVLPEIPLVTQALAEGGTDTAERTWSALRVAQAIAALESGLGPGSVAQAELKTATGDMTDIGVAPNHLTGPGGEFGFWPTVKQSVSSSETHHVAPLIVEHQFTLGTTLLQKFGLLINDLGQTLTVRQRYVQASPPYDMGDGDVFSFIFAIIDNASGKVKTMYHAPDPPWANNGPTNIHPDRIDKITGKKYKTVKSINSDLLLLMNPDFITENEIEITNTFKNSDMELIPHPFQGNDLTGKTIVMFDPMSPVVERLEAVKNAGGDAREFFDGGYINFGNTELGRARPDGLMSVSIAMK